MLELIGKKIGMSHLFNEAGEVMPVTLVKIYDNLVLDVTESEEYDNLSIAFEKIEKTKNINKSVIGLFNKKSVPVHNKIKGCKVKKGAGFKIGDAILIENLVKLGDFIDIRGLTTGKGFAGVMKRHNFAGLEASHGVSVSHRSHGSTGQRQDPGKVFKGKKMAGHMGVDNITVKNLEVVLLQTEERVIAVKGAIPGRKGNDVILKIAA